MSFLAALSVSFWGLVASGWTGQASVPVAMGHNLPVVHSSSTPTTPRGIVYPNFTAKDFPFVTTVPDRGDGKGGGWQVAKVNLEFIRVTIPTDVKVWHCDFKIEMPLRTEVMGKVDAKRAAKFSVEITNEVAANMDYKLPQGIFCERYRRGVEALFPVKYPDLGARVTQ